MKIKKFLLIFISLFLVISLAGCNLIVKDDEITITKETKKFTNYSSEYNIKADKLTIYYVDNKKVPYVDMETFFTELDGLFASEYMTFSKGGFLRQQTMRSSALGISLRSVFNFEEDTITLDDALALNITKTTESTDYSRYYRSANSYMNNSNFISCKFNCKEYGFDFYYKDKLLLVPFSLMNFLYCSTNYYNIYYTEEELSGFYLVARGTERKQVYKSDLWNKETTLAERQDNYNLVKFIMHYFYGLGDKTEALESYKDELLSLDKDIYTNAYFKFFNLYLNENHSGMIYTPYSFDPTNFDSSIYKSDSSKLSDNTIQELINAKNRFYEEDEKLPVVRFKDDLAIIHINEFVTGEDKDLYNEDGSVKEDAYLHDTYFLARYAFSEIEKHDNINKVIIDLANNGGGNGAAMIKLLGFITDEEIPYTSRNYLNGRITCTTYKVDLKGDNSFSQASYANKYKFYVQTSKYSYSAANIFAGICRRLNAATVIGNSTGGGACGIIPIVLPDGASMQISGVSEMIILKDYETFEFDHVESGIQVEDKYIIPYNEYYNDTYLVNFINNL